MDWAEKSKLFICNTVWYWPNGSKVRHCQMPRSIVRVKQHTGTVKGCTIRFGRKFYAVYMLKHFDIGPTVPKLDLVKCQGPEFESWRFQTIFGRHFLSNTLILSKVLPLDWAENSKLFTCKTLWYWPNGSKVRSWQMPRSRVRVLKIEGCTIGLGRKF